MVMFLRNLKVFFENLKVFFWLSRFLAGIIFYTREVLLTSHYEKWLFEHASQPRVACQILDYFLISGVEQTSQEIHISLDEKMNSKLSNDVHFESKGFMQHGSVPKLNRAIPSSAVGARFAHPKTVCFVSSGRQILPYSCRWDRSFSFDIPSWRWVSIQCCCALFPPACLGFVRRCLPIVLPVGGISLSAVLFE